MGGKNNITLSEYIKKNLVIPAYQRGYIWSKKGQNGQKDSVTFLLEDLIEAFKSNNKQEKFLQAITVFEDNDEVNIVDGQQRTVFFYLLLAYLNQDNMPNFSLEYKVRTDSQSFLKDKVKEYLENPLSDNKEEYKDIYFFKNTLKIFKEHKDLNNPDNVSKDDFKKYLLGKVSFLYLPIKKEHVKTTFTMMNGNKAQMRSDELIKAELLRLISIDESNVVINRARVAKEWERWIQWWNKNDVKNIFSIRENKSNDKLKELIVLLYGESEKIDTIKNLNGKDLFLSFKAEYLQNKNNALDTFNKLRKLQKKFEDIYNNPVKYNKAGFILSFNSKFNVLSYIIDNYKDEKKLDTLYYLSAVSTSFKQCEKDMKDLQDENKFYNYCRQLLNDASFENNKEKYFIYLFLLLLNIDNDNNLNRKFDFNITKEKSIEHIYPQSKFKNSDENNHENTITSDIGHSIGNLVLLYKNENSSFSDSDFEHKKNMLFDYSGNEWFKHSIHLLDTIKEFSKSKWDTDEIKARQKRILTFFDINYGKIENDINNFKNINDFIKNN